MVEEIWADVVGYEGLYQVSNNGRIKSYDRKVWNYTKPSRIMKQYQKKNGYNQIGLTDKSGELHKHLYVHRLVAEAFIPNPDNYPQVDHLDGDKQNNITDNLEWVSAQENILRFRKSNLSKKYDEHKSRTLCNKSIQYIIDNRTQVCELYDTGVSIKDVAKVLGLGRDSVTDILKIYDRV